MSGKDKNLEFLRSWRQYCDQKEDSEDIDSNISIREGIRISKEEMKDALLEEAIMELLESGKKGKKDAVTDLLGLGGKTKVKISRPGGRKVGLKKPKAKPTTTTKPKDPSLAQTRPGQVGPRPSGVGVTPRPAKPLPGKTGGRPPSGKTPKAKGPKDGIPKPKSRPVKTAWRTAIGSMKVAALAVCAGGIMKGEGYDITKDTLFDAPAKCIKALIGVYQEIFGNPQTEAEKEHAADVIDCYQKILRMIIKEEKILPEDIKNVKITKKMMLKANCRCTSPKCIEDVQEMWNKEAVNVGAGHTFGADVFFRGIAPYLAYDIATSVQPGDVMSAIGGPLGAGVAAFGVGAAAVGAGVSRVVGGAKKRGAGVVDRIKRSFGKLRTPGKTTKVRFKESAGEAKISLGPVAGEVASIVRSSGYGGMWSIKKHSIPFFNQGGQKITERKNFVDIFESTLVSGTASEGGTMSKKEAFAQASQQQKSIPRKDGISSWLYSVYWLTMLAKNPIDTILRKNLIPYRDFITEMDQALTAKKLKTGMDFYKDIKEVPVKNKFITLDNISALDGEVTTLKEIGIQHNLEGEAKTLAELFVKKLLELGVDNRFILAGALAVAGKESGFVGKAEGSWYSYRRLTVPKISSKGNKIYPAVAGRTMKVFRHQLGRLPTDEEWRGLSSDIVGAKGGIALFNIAYGYAPVKSLRYTTYQKIPKSLGGKDFSIPHSVPVSINGKINPALYNPNLAGYKFRGRGPIQSTFAETYARTAASAGLNVGEVLSNPDILVKNPEIGVIMSAGFTRNAFDKASRNLERQFGTGVPSDFLEGIMFMACLAGGGGGKNLHRAHWFKRAVNNATKKANKHIRVIEIGSSAEVS